MDCKVRVKAQEKFGKGAKCKEKVKQKKSAGKEENCKICVKRQRSFGKEDFYENEVKRQQNSGKAKFCKDGVKQQQEASKVAADGIRWEATAEAGDNNPRAHASRQPVSACEQPQGTRQVVPERKMTTTMRGGRGMVEKRRESIPRGKAQKAAPERRRGYFYLWLAAWWPTVAGRKRLTRKGVRKRLQALEEPQ